MSIMEYAEQLAKDGFILSSRGTELTVVSAPNLAANVMAQIQAVKQRIKAKTES